MMAKATGFCCCRDRGGGLCFRSVRNRAFRIFLLAVIAAWFGVVVPLHPRGVIKLGGASARSCCHRGSDSKHPDSKPDPSECAVCHFVGTLDLPPAIGLELPPLGLVELLVIPAPQEAPCLEWGVPSVERAPPMA